MVRGQFKAMCYGVGVELSHILRHRKAYRTIRPVQVSESHSGGAIAEDGPEPGHGEGGLETVPVRTRGVWPYGPIILAGIIVGGLVYYS